MTNIMADRVTDTGTGMGVTVIIAAGMIIVDITNTAMELGIMFIIDMVTDILSITDKDADTNMGIITDIKY